MNRSRVIYYGLHCLRDNDLHNKEICTHTYTHACAHTQRLQFSKIRPPLWTTARLRYLRGLMHSIQGHFFPHNIHEITLPSNIALHLWGRLEVNNESILYCLWLLNILFSTDLKLLRFWQLNFIIIKVVYGGHFD